MPASSYLPLGAVDKEIGDFGGDAAVKLAIEHDGGRKSAVSEAEYRFESEAAVFCGLAQLGPETILHVPDHVLAAHRLAGLSAAYAQYMAARGSMAKVVIEADDAMDFGMGKIEGIRDERNGSLIDVAKLILKGVEDREQGARQVLQFADSR
jgi:hypothetical protein